MGKQKLLEVGASHATISTAGYSGHTPESFVAALTAAGVEQVLDVRSRPFSRKAGFSKNALDEFLRSKGLTYVHLPALGAPPEMLDKKSEGLEFAQLAPIYRRHLAKQKAAFEEAQKVARARPSALICLEKDPKECHRGILAQQFAKNGWDVVHL